MRIILSAWLIVLIEVLIVISIITMKITTLSSSLQLYPANTS